MALENSMANHLLVAMPKLNDPHFARSVIFLCEHHERGAVGLVINRPMPYPLSLVFEQLRIEAINININKRPLLSGGPIQPERGFVIHRPFGVWRSSLALRDGVTITTSNDIIRAMANNAGPDDAIVALGYSGWEQGQLDKEVIDDFWLVCPYKDEILYDVPFEDRWLYAGSLIGVDMTKLTINTGNA